MAPGIGVAWRLARGRNLEPSNLEPSTSNSKDAAYNDFFQKWPVNVRGSTVRGFKIQLFRTSWKSTFQHRIPAQGNLSVPDPGPGA
jgi:hypothetical protein